MLATVQLAGGNRSGAETTLRQDLKLVGPDLATSSRLVELLLEDKQTGEAVTVAEAAREAAPENTRALWLLGRTRMKAGQKAVALSTLSSALRQSDDPGLTNNIAYELADGGYANDEVEAAIRSAVKKLTDETAAWSLSDADQDIADMRRRSSLLVATWDTLGWTIYKSPSGHEPARLGESARYLVASWHNCLTPIVGLHLGNLQEAQHHPAEALVTYQLADAASSHVDLRGLAKAADLVQRELAARIEALKKSQPAAALKDPAEALRRQLKLLAGASGNQPLVIPYRMLLTADGIHNAVPLATSDGDHGDPDPGRDLSRFHRAIPAVWIPADSPARILRSAVLNCHSGVCEVMLTPLAATR